MSYYLSIRLITDACFSGGSGHAGEVDTEIEYEEETGLPLLRGRILKGLLVEECAMLLSTLSDIHWENAARELFGASGLCTGAKVAVSDAFIPEPVRQVVQAAIDRDQHPLSSNQILRSFTDIRYQTKINFDTGAPEKHSLRATRVALKGLVWHSRLVGTERLTNEEKALFAACVLAVRRGGLNRNRGWGRLEMRIIGENQSDVTPDWVALLRKIEKGENNGKEGTPISSDT